uniref:G domain-containing protein n=2 Tax=Clytia hemisphaerica TaxID=252671 RepID=A0A7M5X3K0_9CNID
MINILKEKAIENDNSKIENVESDKPPYVILVGNVGTGKSTIVEKLTGVKGRSSSTSESFTRESKQFKTPDGSLHIADTPGSNPRSERFQQNQAIASAFAYQEISKVLIVVRADVRMDQTLADVKDYNDRFIELPEDLVGVLVTHMDLHKEWTEKDFSVACNEDFEIKDVIFSSVETSQSEIQETILKICRTSYSIEIGSSLFSKLFKTENSKFKVLKVSKQLIKHTKDLMVSFEQQRQQFTKREDKRNLIFEFRAWFEVYWKRSLLNQAIHLLDPQFKEIPTDLKQGYLTNISNEMDSCIEKINMRIDRYNNKVRDGTARACPFCGKLWESMVKVCGNSNSNTTCLECTQFEMKTFTFSIQNRHQLSILKNPANEEFKSRREMVGCGRQLTWNDMKIVSTISNNQESLPKDEAGPSRKQSSTANWNAEIDKDSEKDSMESLSKNDMKIRSIILKGQESLPKDEAGPSRNDTPKYKDHSRKRYVNINVEISKTKVPDFGCDQTEVDTIN